MKKKLLIATFVAISFFACKKEESPTKEINSDISNFPSDTGHDTIWVSNVTELMATVNSTKVGNKVVIIKDGTYELTDRLWLTGNNLIYRSESQNRDKVILKGKGMNGSIGYIFGISGDNFSIKDISLGEVFYHGIQIHGELDADNFYAQNVRFFNIRQQMIKGSYDKNKPHNHCDFGVVENCLFEYTATHSHYYYCGGVDVHHGVNWRISNCTFKNIYSPENALSEGGIHFWNNSEGTIVENNTFINCDRGIMFGMDNSPHKGGIIRNNMLHITRDVGIYLCYASDAKVYNNSIYTDSSYPNSIEYRFAQTTNCHIANNLTSKLIANRNTANGVVENNITNVQADWFISPKQADLHLKSAKYEIVDKAIDLQEVETDFDGDERILLTSDIGADEMK